MDDQLAAAVINAVELPAANGRGWFDAVSAVASQQPDDWSGFVDQLRATGTQYDSSIDDSVIDRFVENLERLTSAPLSVVMELAEYDPQDLAAQYGQRDAAAEGTYWGWVPADIGDRLQRGMGDDWPQAVTATFDQIWPGWEAADDATKATTLTQWIDTILGEAVPDGSDSGAADAVIDERLRYDIASTLEASGLPLAELDPAELDRILQDAARLARAARTS
ncbi:hypothetical protein ALI144C_24150 [Actinosynnema sp. ALI-1.44]|uniref:hypothetical protein n=1 Tax=Actinosynnema sp. ALI-1.44 TaxID=1933779 RepID=UPI00097C2053|nr:hypothetical protein [Actinosynnema sp. ALI-1.44]ONI79829.1 hypothetical protein ALI144C_24150 [Actinosynnema sp. ALI-1.44]